MARRFWMVLVLVLALAPGAFAASDQTVYVVPIHGVIDQGLAAFVSRVMEDAAQEQVAAVIFDINTPGGALDAALKIRDTILYSEVNTVAFVNPRAISAGSLISLACRHLVMAGGGTIGAATAVDLEGHKASEKVISYFRNEMKATAERRGRPPKLAEAMVDEDVDVPGLAPKGKLLTLTTEDAVAQKVAEYAVQGTTRQERLQDVLQHFGLSDAQVERPSINWVEQGVRWLTYPYVASLLMTLGFLGLIFEVFTPGWGVGGTIGLVCLGLFFGSHIMASLADWGDVLLFIIGAALVVVDLFFVAGFGILGFPGILLMVASLFLSLMGRTELWTVNSVSKAVQPLVLAFVSTIVVTIVMVKMLPHTSAWNWVVLRAENRSSAGYRASSGYDDLVGAEGVAFTSLRPSGTGLFDGRRVSVTTEGDFVERDTPIKVLHVEGNRIVVRRV